MGRFDVWRLARRHGGGEKGWGSGTDHPNDDAAIWGLKTRNEGRREDLSIASVKVKTYIRLWNITNRKGTLDQLIIDLKGEPEFMMMDKPKSNSDESAALFALKKQSDSLRGCLALEGSGVFSMDCRATRVPHPKCRSYLACGEAFLQLVGELSQGGGREFGWHTALLAWDGTERNIALLASK